MVKKKEKMLSVEEDLHKQIKKQAIMKDMTIRDYLRYLANKDN